MFEASITSFLQSYMSISGQIHRIEGPKLVESHCKKIGEHFIPLNLLLLCIEMDAQELFDEIPKDGNTLDSGNVDTILTSSKAVEARESLIFTVDNAECRYNINQHRRRKMKDKPSFAEAVKKNTNAVVVVCPEDVAIVYKPSVLKDGVPTFMLTKEELEATLDTCKWHLS